ncbi:Uncharacterised protein [Raoultella terrigena]|uniref:Uncharacterized protein n=1 Tax=Raoultella terrigena TaxID=577 RepID=A0A4U9D3B7_RAOTE|nr:Uncharacterised protein [Raoultella terrigena]
MMKRVALKVFVVVLMVTWLILPSTIIPASYSKVYELYSPDKNHKVIIYHGKIILSNVTLQIFKG